MLLLNLLLSFLLFSLLNSSQFLLQLYILLSTQLGQLIDRLFLLPHISVQFVHLLIKLLNLVSHRLNLFLFLSVFLLHFFMLCRSTLFINFNCLLPFWLFFFILHFLKSHLFLLLQNFNSIDVTLNIVLLSDSGQSIYFVHYVFSKNSIFFSHFHGFLNLVICWMYLLNNYLILFSQTWELRCSNIFLGCVYVQHTFHTFIGSFLFVF